MDATTIAIDLAKDVFQVAISDVSGYVTARRRLSRQQFSKFVETLGSGTTVVMEACSTAHYWGRRCRDRGAVVRVLPAQYVRPYVQRDKTDRADTDALLEAHRCARIHAVPLKTVEQQTIQELHRIRRHWQTTRIARINLLRALLREHGYVFPTGAALIHRRVAATIADSTTTVPPLVRQAADMLLDELRSVEAKLKDMDRQLARLAATHPTAIRLQQIPGIGVLTATALIGSVPHIHAFRRGRQFASWLGLTPRESSSGHRRWIGHMSKRGDAYLRMLLVHGARSALRIAELRAQQGAPITRLQHWAVATVARRGRNRTAVAFANKLARIVWAVWTREGDFHSAVITM
jgi:transposase